MTREITNSDDMIDVRDVIERFEELESEREDATTGEDKAADSAALEAWDATDDGAEYANLKSLLDDLNGNGGDEQWRGDWYPVGLIRHSYFVDAMEELVKDIGDLPQNIPGYLAIDWDATAENLRVDYTSTEFDGVEYWYR